MGRDKGWTGGWGSLAASGGGSGRLGTRGGRETDHKSFWLDLCMCIHFHAFIPTKIIVFNFKRKAPQARCDEGQNGSSGGEGGRKGGSQEQSCQDSVTL